MIEKRCQRVDRCWQDIRRRNRHFQCWL